MLLDENEKDAEMEEFLNSILNEEPKPSADDSDTPADETDESEESIRSDEENMTESNETNEDLSEQETEEPEDNSPRLIPDEEELRENFGKNDSEEHDEAPKRKKTRKKKKKKGRAGRLVFALVLTTLIVCISIFIAVFILNTVKSVTGLDRPDYQVVVDIPENSTTDEISQILLDNSIIDNAELFSLMAKLKGVDGSFTAGSHVLSPNMSYSDIMTELQEYYEEERETVDITFSEGITLCEAADLLEKNGVCEAERFIYIFNSSSFGFDFEDQVETSSDKFMKMEGFLFPDTYTFYVEEEPEVVAKKFYKNFENRITPDLYGRMKDLGISLEDTITLASIVQAEAGDPSDMKKVASVFWNRLNNPKEFPRLESDPTRKYVEDTIEPNIEVPDEEMFKKYNTYEGEGLPPGAIGNPGLEAVNAVLYPADTNYYFFCADLNTGEVFYAETLDEHEQNLVKAHLTSQRK